MAYFFSQKINIFAGRFAYGRGDTNKCHDNNRGLRSSVAMLRTLNLNAKINTCGQNPFFVRRDMLQCRFETDFPENGNPISRC